MRASRPASRRLSTPAIPADAMRVTIAPTTNSSLELVFEADPWVTCQWATSTSAEALAMTAAAIG